MIPVVLAGGLGTRARPLSARRPKPLLPVVNRPLLERTLAALAAAGFAEALILTDQDAGRIRAVLGDGAGVGLRLHYHASEQDWGTGGALCRGVATLPGDRFLVIHGDLIFALETPALVEAHERAGALVTIALTRVANPLQFGIVIIDGDGRVRRFLEKPSWGEVFSDTVNAGIYVVERSALDEAPATAFDFSGDLFPALLAAGAPLYGHVTDGYWRDIGDPDSYLAAHLDFFAGKLRLLPPGRLVEHAARAFWLEGEAEIEASVEIRGMVVIGEGCHILAGARLEDVVLGAGTVIGEGAELRRSVAWEGVHIGAGAHLQGAVLGEGVTVGPGCELETGCVIADATTLGREVRVKERVKIWPAKVVEDHAVVHSNLVYADRWRTSAFEEGAFTGLTNLELTPEVAARLGAAYGTLLEPGSTILTVRDAHPASRMLRRAFVGGVGSTGVQVVDLGLLPVPVMRFRLEAALETGGVSFQQVQLLRGLTSIRFFAAGGLDIAPALAKSLERVFVREEFRRVQHHQIGVIFEHPRLLDAYAEAYLKALPVQAIRQRRFHLVVDHAHSAAMVILPRLLAELGCEVVTLNAHTGVAPEPLLAEEIEQAHARLGAIVTSLGADLGIWLFPGDERLVVIDRRGRRWSDMELVALVIAATVAAQAPRGTVLLPAYAPSTFRAALEPAGYRVKEVLATPRSLTEAAREDGVVLATAGEGDLIFPALHHSCDALFAIGKLLELLQRAGKPAEAIADLAPAVPTAHLAIACPIERKGAVMRRFVEAAAGAEVSFVDGARIALDGEWVLLRPDRIAPQLHLHAESTDGEHAARLLERWALKLEAIVRGAEEGKWPG
ncbi:MAG: sugar phosphate nucleotidyltransferase [Acidobacteriota bacterium]